MNTSLFRRQAFTLVELLVVITIIAMLAGLLIPAVNGAREAARRGQCVDRMRQIGIAFQSYANANNGLPGHVNTLPHLSRNGISLSWVEEILPQLQESKRYEYLTESLPNPVKVREAIARLDVVLCPSNYDIEDDAPLCFVVNCGPTETNANGDPIDGDTAPYFSLFKDRRVPLLNKKVKLEEIPDGTSNTILLSENLQALCWSSLSRTWLGAAADMETSGTPPVATRSNEVVGHLGFVWSDTVDPSATNPIVKINALRKPLLAGITVSSTNRYNFARPSSYHPGLVNVLYADGTVKIMNDDVDLSTYLKAVCPDSDKAQQAPPIGLGL